MMDETLRSAANVFNSNVIKGKDYTTNKFIESTDAPGQSRELHKFVLKSEYSTAYQKELAANTSFTSNLPPYLTLYMFRRIE